MGEGGSVVLVNGTPYTWKRVDQGSYQMHAWNFPEVISPGTVPSTYVEFNQGVFTTRSDTSGSVKYVLEGTECFFTINIRDKPSNIFIRLDNMEANNHLGNTDIQLGWRHDGSVYFVLSGKQGSFDVSDPPIDWMQRCRDTLGQRPLSQICMLGTHNSGMSSVSHCDVPAGILDDYVLCQSTNVYGQLINGSRYFDIRPQISGGQFWTGHYNGKVGARGESLATIISGVKQFTQQFAELVVLNFSHALQTDADGWRDFNADEWRSLMKELLQLDHLYVVKDKSMANNLSLLKLDDFIGNGKAAVVCVIDNDALDFGEFATKGFYKTSQLNIRNEYSDKDDAVIMVNDQLGKMKGHMSAKDKRLSLLSWTLTQQMPRWDGDVFGFLMRIGQSLKPIRTLAYTCNKELFTRVLPEVGLTSFPNVIYIDYLDNRDFLSLVIAVNDRIM
ncbi:unnamed protein product [Fusarium equiseti]|uniref:Variant-surface-glycoprotein phospholipase C n=1 Tax=Fusarium equiseti TaxID=61235 RepID=A0A8J2IVB9_FUSEQ|nr:unnamed protein product [Fusarium equiseti]